MQSADPGASQLFRLGEVGRRKGVGEEGRGWRLGREKMRGREG